jgi:putative FmdB family regulatory protein
MESIQKFSDAPLTDCPACHKSELKKLISAPAFRLNGSGWYETDFKTGKKKNLTSDSGNTSSADAASPASTPATAPPAPSTPSTNTSSAV